MVSFFPTPTCLSVLCTQLKLLAMFLYEAHMVWFLNMSGYVTCRVMSHDVSHNVMLTVPLVLSECGTSELNSWMGVQCTVREILC